MKSIRDSVVIIKYCDNCCPLPVSVTELSIQPLNSQGYQTGQGLEQGEPGHRQAAPAAVAAYADGRRSQEADTRTALLVAH